MTLQNVLNQYLTIYIKIEHMQVRKIENLQIQKAILCMRF